MRMTVSVAAVITRCRRFKASKRIESNRHKLLLLNNSRQFMSVTMSQLQNWQWKQFFTSKKTPFLPSNSKKIAICLYFFLQELKRNDDELQWEYIRRILLLSCAFRFELCISRLFTMKIPKWNFFRKYYSDIALFPTILRRFKMQVP